MWGGLTRCESKSDTKTIGRDFMVIQPQLSSYRLKYSWVNPPWQGRLHGKLTLLWVVLFNGIANNRQHLSSSHPSRRRELIQHYHHQDPIANENPSLWNQLSLGVFLWDSCRDGSQDHMPNHSWSALQAEEELLDGMFHLRGGWCQDRLKCPLGPTTTCAMHGCTELRPRDVENSRT